MSFNAKEAARDLWHELRQTMTPEYARDRIEAYLREAYERGRCTPCMLGTDGAQRCAQRCAHRDCIARPGSRLACGECEEAPRE